jgi:cobalt-zinc-cadmium efflux system outer membrane protein
MQKFFSRGLFALWCGWVPVTGLPAAEPRAVESYVSEALGGNPELKFYEAEMVVARGQRALAGSWQNPEIGTKAGRLSAENLEGVKTGDGLAWQVTVSQTFEFPGRLALRKAIANRQIELAQLGLEQFRAALGMRVRMLAFKLLAAQERADAARVVSDRFQDLLAVLVQRDPAGVAPLLATRIIEASGLSVNRRAAEAEKELFNARFELNQLRGLPPDTAVSVKRTPFLLPPAVSLEELLKSARVRNFEVRARAVEMEQQGFRVKLSENERWPAVTLQPYVAGQRGSERQREFGLGLSVPLPLVNRNQGNIVVGQARQKQAEVAMTVAVREMERQVAAASNSYRIQMETMAKWPPSAAVRFSEAAQLADQHYRLGAVPISTYVELQTQYLDAVDAMLATQLDAMEARQQVELLAGVTMEGTAVACRETPVTVRLTPPAQSEPGTRR